MKLYQAVLVLVSQAILISALILTSYRQSELTQTLSDHTKRLVDVADAFNKTADKCLTPEPPRFGVIGKADGSLEIEGIEHLSPEERRALRGALAALLAKLNSQGDQ